MNTGRILNEPHEVYHGPSDKPKFGSGAIKLWLQDQEQFYRTYVSGDIERPQLGRAGIIGNAVEEPVLERRDNRIASEYKTACAGLQALQEANPDKHVLTISEMDLTQNLINGCLNDDLFSECIDAGIPQVTYRVDVGPFYIQARIDLEVEGEDVPERVLDECGISFEQCGVLAIDLKTCATHYGQYAFSRVAGRSPLLYPVQEALYREVMATVLCIKSDLIPFWFVAVSKDTFETKWYEFLDSSHAARNRVLGAIGELKHRYESNYWDDFKQKTRIITLPDNYLQWVGE